MNSRSTRRAILWANTINLFVGFYLIIIAIVSLIKLRWYHQITITVRVRHILALTSTSYFAFVVLIVTGLLLVGIFITNLLSQTTKVYISPSDHPSGIEITSVSPTTNNPTEEFTTHNDPINVINNDLDHTRRKHSTDHRYEPTDPVARPRGNDHHEETYVIKDRIILRGSNGKIYCWTFWHILASVCMILILTIWLANRGELVRQAISNQLENTYSRYEFTNRTNYYSVLIDGMQDINNCCGQFDYSDFPHLGATGLSYGHYPGSCCGKNIFGSNARVICKPEEIIFSGQTTGCLHVIGAYYDFVSFLIVPAALMSLLLQIITLFMVTINSPNDLIKSYHRCQSINMNQYKL